MTSDAEAKRLAEATRSQLTLPLEFGDEYRYGHLSLCVLLDAIFSIGVRYEGTAAVVRRYAQWAQIPLSRPRTELPPARSGNRSATSLRTSRSCGWSGSFPDSPGDGCLSGLR